MRYWILWFNLCFFFNWLLSQLCCSFLVNTHTIASKLKKIREMLLTTLEHKQHDVIDVIWRLPVWNVKIRRYLASWFRRHILYWYNKINLLDVPKAPPLQTKFQKSSCLRHENSIVGMDPMATHCRKLIILIILILGHRVCFRR
jgi:hypothetical protein